MATGEFRYRALDAAGADIAGVVYADDEKDAYGKLAARGLSPYDIARRTASASFLPRRGGRIGSKRLAQYLKQLGTLLSANVTLMEAFTTLARSRAHAGLAERTEGVLSDLRSGRKLSMALKSRFQEFPDYVFQLADLGEMTGALAKALSDAADRMEYDEAVRSDLRSALSYPIFLAAVGGAIVLLMFLFVVPRFAALLGEDLAKAPGISQAVIGTGLWLRANVAAVFVAGGAIGFGVAVIARNAALATAVRREVERLPVVGPLLRTAELARWCRTVGVGVLNKAPLMDALRLGEGGAVSPGFRNRLQEVRRLVRAGRPLEEALGEAIPDFEPIVLDLIRTGRNAGALGEMLVFGAEGFEKETRERTRQVTALAEPAAIVLISLVVGSIVISIVLAMTSLYEFAV